MTKLKIFCYPIVFDTYLNIIKLDGDEISLIRKSIATNLIGNENNDSFNLDGFEEVEPEVFSDLAYKHASCESMRKFWEQWRTIFGNKS